MVTSAPPHPQTSSAAVPTEAVYQLSVEQYHAMLEHGILHSGDPVELLEGFLIAKMTKNLPHSALNDLVADVLREILPKGWHVRVQNPITLETSEPEPDLAIVQGTPRDYLKRHPTAQDVALVIEISDSTLERDRTLKKAIYAKAGILIYWIINLVEQRIEIYAQPEQHNDEFVYQQVQFYGPTDQVPVMIEGQAIAHIPVSNLLP
jgi:Putative restriction endonuclease